MKRNQGTIGPTSTPFGRRRIFPYGNKVVIDTASEQIYFPEYMLPPLGYQEQIDIKKGTRICEILDTNVDEYINGFINYFINDEATMKQCLNILQLKDSVDSSLVKKITFDFGGPFLLSVSDGSSTSAGSNYRHCQAISGLTSVASTPSIGSSGTPYDSQPNDACSRSRYSDSNSDSGYRPMPWGGYHMEYSGRGREHATPSSLYYALTPTSRDEDFQSNMSPPNSSKLKLSLNGLMQHSNATVNDDAHYMKISQYHSFFVDVTNLLTQVPLLGSDIMTVPQVMLLLLDKKIVPLLFQIIDRIVDAGCPPNYNSILNMFNNMYGTHDISNERISVNKYLGNMLNYIYCKYSLGEDTAKGEISNFHFTARLKNIPPIMPFWKSTVDEISDNDVGNMVVLVATVTRVGAISVLDEEREYKCTKCGQSVVAKAVPELHYFISVPTKCPHWLTRESGDRRQRCNADSFIQSAAVMRTDIQEIRCQSIARGSSVAYVGGTTPVVLRRDITGTCVPGDNIHIIAFVKRRWNTLRNGRRCESQIFLDAINIEVMNINKVSTNEPSPPILDSMYYPFWYMYRSDEVAGRQVILESMWTTLVSVDNAKLAILLCIIGGFPIKDRDMSEEGHYNKWAKYTKTERENTDATSRSSYSLPYTTEENNQSKLLRTQCHILLLGCPGTGKSQFLKYAKTLVDRHVTVSGTNCSTAGLTCTIIRDGANSMLSAGALVLADGGICCIDEFALIHPDDKACLHEAMEQQLISVAKVGIKCSLNCRCSVIAASNFKMPKGRNVYTLNEEEAMNSESGRHLLNIDVPLPLLSRFDVILVFTENPLNDDELLDFLLADQNETNDALKTDGKQSEYGGSQSQQTPPDYGHFTHADTVDWNSANAIKNYIDFIKANVFPTLSESAKNIIHAYYMALRKQAQDVDLPGGPTIRTIESLIRLSQAHARLMLRNEVDVFDTVSVIWLGEIGLQGYRVGTCSGSDQVVDRQGLFPNIKELFNSYAFHHSREDRHHVPKMGNGITTMGMYRYFEDVLLRRLNLVKVEIADGTWVVHPAQNSDIFPDY